MSVNAFSILALGGLTGVLSGMLGVGGGFLMTPLLIFLGIPPAVSVASCTNQIVAQSFSAFLRIGAGKVLMSKWENFILLGSISGSAIGVMIFKILKESGQIDLVISLSYVFFLGLVGIIMGVESGRKILNIKKKSAKAKSDKPRLRHTLPLQIHFPASNLTISALVPTGLGFSIGLVVTFMGTGGGFMLIPAMLYLIGMPTTVVVGTSLYHAIFVTANVTFLQAVTNQTVDVLLAFLLLAGSVFGAQIGTRLGGNLPTEYLRAALAFIVLAVAAKLGLGLVIMPETLFSVAEQ